MQVEAGKHPQAVEPEFQPRSALNNPRTRKLL